MNKGAQYAVYIASFRAAGIELTIAIGACATFSKAVIAFGVYNTFLVDGGQVSSARTYIFTSFEYYRFDAMLYQSKGCEQSLQVSVMSLKLM